MRTLILTMVLAVVAPVAVAADPPAVESKDRARAKAAAALALAAACDCPDGKADCGRAATAALSAAAAELKAEAAAAKVAPMPRVKKGCDPGCDKDCGAGCKDCGVCQPARPAAVTPAPQLRSFVGVDGCTYTELSPGSGNYYRSSCPAPTAVRR